MPIPRLKPYKGPAILSYGFRPFFLLGALYSGLSMLLWLPAFYGVLQLSTVFAPVDWHIHELYFGFLPAIITGFLFTARSKLDRTHAHTRYAAPGPCDVMACWPHGYIFFCFSSIGN